MGLFTNPCENPDCSARVKKGAHFCSKCGWAGANSLTSCPDCQKKVGRTSSFCWNCGADITKERPPRIVGGYWVREDEEFAVRINPNDVQGFLSQRVAVEPGTVGVVERSNKIISRDEWGQHTLDAVFRMHSPRGIILVSAADAVLRPTFSGLRDINGAEVDVTLQLVFSVSNHEAFASEFFEGHKRRVTYRSLEEKITHELHDVARGLVNAHSMEDMYGNLQWRDDMEAKLRDAMSVTLTRYGLELLQLNFVEFGGDHFETLQQDRGEVYMGNHAADHLAEKVAIRKRTMELQAQGKIDERTANADLAFQVKELNGQYAVREVLSDSDREETIAQARHELELKGILRKLEMEDLETERQNQVEMECLVREQELEKIKVAHDLEVADSLLIGRNKLAANKDEFRREQERLNNEHSRKEFWAYFEVTQRQAQVDANGRCEQRLAEARTQLDVDKLETEGKIKKLEHENLSEDAKLKRKMDYENHLQEIRERDGRLDVERKRLKTEDLRLILEYKKGKAEIKAGAQVDIATSGDKTRAAVAEAVSGEKDRQLADKDAQADRIEKAHERGFEAIERVVDKLAGTKSEPNVIVTGSGGISQVGGTSQETAPCPKCNKPVPISNARCPHCLHAMVS